MGHNPATREAKRSEKKEAEALRTPAERLAAIRSSCAPNCTVFVTKDDVRFLLGLYDELDAIAEQQTQAIQIATATTRTDQATIADLQAKLAEFRDVYEQENSSTTLTVERVLSLNNPAPDITEVEAPVLPGAVYIALTSLDDPLVSAEIGPCHFVDHGGEA
jgi:hypothetical protein